MGQNDLRVVTLVAAEVPTLKEKELFSLRCCDVFYYTFAQYVFLLFFPF